MKQIMNKWKIKNQKMMAIKINKNKIWMMNKMKLNFKRIVKKIQQMMKMTMKFNQKHKMENNYIKQQTTMMRIKKISKIR